MIFDPKELQLPKKLENHARALKAEGRSLLQLGMAIKELEKTIGQLEDGDLLHFMTPGKWSMHELLEYLLLRTGPAEVYLTTWTMTEQPASAIARLHRQGQIEQLNCVLDHRIKERSPKAFQVLSPAITRHRLTHIHAKTTVIRNADWGIAVVGSSNYSRNPRIETGTITVSKTVADFHIDWITQALNEGEDGRK